MSKKWNSVAARNLYHRAVETWGVIPQVDQAVEELAEAIVALQKLFKRDFSYKRMEDLASELADVKITMAQVKYILESYSKLPSDTPDGTSFAEMVDNAVNYKLDRLQKRLDDANFQLNKVPSNL